jgi:hypothetical protein
VSNTENLPRREAKALTTKDTKGHKEIARIAKIAEIENKTRGARSTRQFQPQCSGLQSGTMKIFHRSHLILFLAGATATGFLINSLHASTSDEQAVLAPITAMFDAMAKRDATAIKKPLLPGGGLVLMRDGKPIQMTFDAFADAVGKAGNQIEERIHDPLVRIDNDLAVVWAPFEFLVDGKVNHCGTDLFNLVRADGKWLIASIADTGRNDCAGQQEKSHH